MILISITVVTACSHITFKIKKGLVLGRPAVIEGTTHIGPAVIEEGTTHIGPAVIEGTTHIGPAVIEGTTHIGPAVIEGTTHIGPATWLSVGESSVFTELLPDECCFFNSPRMSGRGGGIATVFKSDF
uniref:Uncharacterized protein n=1 Tax=Sander lucioperca TaxID=283035 RepID=A0A8C9XYV1_SANLU